MLPMKMELTEELAANLRKLRLTNTVNGEILTAEQLSRKIGNNRAWMSQIESRRLKKIKREDIIAIYKLLFNISSDQEAETKAENELSYVRHVSEHNYVISSSSVSMVNESATPYGTDIARPQKMVSVTKPEYSLSIKISENFQKGTPIIYNKQDITQFIFHEHDKRELHYTTEQIKAFIEFCDRIQNIIIARGYLLSILSRLHSLSIDEIQSQLSDYHKEILSSVVVWYEDCWNNISDVFSEDVKDVKDLYRLINKCFILDEVAIKEFHLIELPFDFSWLREKLCYADIKTEPSE